MNDLNTIKENLNKKVSKNRKFRKIYDGIFNSSTFALSLICIIVLFSVLYYVFSNGISYFSWDLLTSNYSQESYSLKTKDDFVLDETISYSDLKFEEDTKYSLKWGVGLKIGEDVNKNEVIYISEISSSSPFKELVIANTDTIFELSDGLYIENITFIYSDGTYHTAYKKNGIDEMIEIFENGIKIYDSNFLTYGGGIKGSLLTTLMLILLTLIIALPIGIGGAIYLGFYGKDNRFNKILRTLVDMASGIPSIIFGLVGATVFIPIVSGNGNGGNIFSGALTLTIILLPTIIKSVEESIKTIPKDMINASLSLGASEKQTIFRVVLPNSIEGILNAVILSIGRIIGESAALVFAFGTVIGDNLSFSKGNATLAVHIWSILGGETPQYNQACAISILIIIVVLILSIISKILSYYFKRKKTR